MRYKTFGKTGLSVSAVGFGGMRFLAEGYKHAPETCAELVLRAHELGVNYFDTAPGYCEEQSESIFGLAFKQLKRDTFYVSTKCGLWNAKDADGARAMVEQSLKRMGVGYIDFYNIWCLKHMDDYREYMRKGGIYEGVQKAKEEGLIRHICASVHADGEDIETIVKDGFVDGVTVGYNAMNFAYRRQGVAAAHAADLGVVVMNPLGGGVIPRHAYRFAFLRERVPGATLAQAALAFLIGQDAVTVALPGISTLAELEECVAAAEMALPVTDADLTDMGARLREELDALCTGCAYCDCPSGLPVPRLMDAYNEYILAEHQVKALKDRLSIHWDIRPAVTANCTECGQCESHCTQRLPIIKRLKEIRAM